MDFDNYERPPRPRRQPRPKWNYKRIAVAFGTLFVICMIAVYGGYTLAHKLTDNPKTQAATSNDTVKVASEVVRPNATTTTTTEQHFLQYTVEEGDTLYAIALENDTTIEKIKEINKIPDENNDLQIGMILKIPTTKPVEETTSTPEKEVSAIKPSRQEIGRGPQTKKRVALTFDAGSTSKATPKILRELKSAGLTATFFLTGQWIEENQGLAKQIADDGHLIGNHTYSHLDLTKASENDIIYQLRKADEAIVSATGQSSKPLFRPPYGARDGRVLRIAAESGYRSIYWTIDSLDWKPGMKSEQVKNRVLAGMSNGSIILMHCGSEQTSEMLPELVKEIENRGYEIVTVPQLFE